jgi:hypothetical protein
MLAAGLLLLVAACSGSHPEDDELSAAFRDNRASFDRLRDLARQEPRIVRLSHDWAADAQGNRFFGPTRGVIPVERWGEYRTLFYELGILDGFEVRGGAVYLFASGAGHGESRTVKGYVHSTRTLRACDSVSDAEAAGREGCHRPLGDGWSLFLRRPGG